MRAALLVLLVAGASAQADTVSVTVTTTPAGGTYAPRNVVAVWIEDAGGNFVKTIGRWANVRKANLVAWTAKAGPNDADAVSGATRPDHATDLSITWDLLDRAGATVPDGTYTIRMELADRNTTTTTPNHEGTFTFVKSTTAQTQNGLSNGGFNNVIIDFQPGAGSGSGSGSGSGGSGSDTGNGSGSGSGSGTGSGSDPISPSPTSEPGTVIGGCTAGGTGGGALSALVALAFLRRRNRRHG